MNIPRVPVNLRGSEIGGAGNLDICYDWLSSVDREKKDKYAITSDFVLPKALDDGWGWVVVFGSFIANFISCGIFASVGVIYTELLTQYNESKSKTSLVGSVFYGMSMLLGPLASVLTSRYGCRVVTIMGGLVSSLGMLLSVFASSVNDLCVTFGFVVGAGFCLVFITSVTIVSFYFDKKISLATGIAVCGADFGTVSFSPFIEFLIQELKLNGMFLILSGVCLNLVVCGMLFRPLKFSKEERLNIMLGRFDEIPYKRSDIEMPESFLGVSPVDAQRNDTMSLVGMPTFIPDYLKTKDLVYMIDALHWGKNTDLTLQRYMINGSAVDNPLLSRKNSELTVHSHPIFGSYVDRYHKSGQSAIRKLESLSVNDITEITSTEQVRVLRVDSTRHHLDIVRASKRGSIYIAQGERFRSSLHTTRLTLRRESVLIHSTAPRRSVQYGGQCAMSRKASVKRQYREHQRPSQVPRTSNVDDRTLPGHRVFVTSVPLYRTDIFFRRLDRGSCVIGTSCPQLYVNDIYGREKIHLLRRVSSSLVKGVTTLVDFSLFGNFSSVYF